MTEADRISPSLRRAYRMTSYEAEGVTVRVGRRSPAFDQLLHRYRSRAAIFVGADNPHSRRMPPAWNRRKLARLRDAARRWPMLPAQGSWCGWREAHVVLFADLRPALRLARMFHQNAVVIVRLHRQPRIIPVV